MIALILALLAKARALAAFVAEGLHRMITAPWAGPVLAALCLFLAIQLAAGEAIHRRKLNAAVAAASQKAAARVERAVERATVKEVIRRETVLRNVQVRARRDVADLDALRTRLLNLQEVSKHASRNLAGVACLPADSVMRINQVR